MALFVLAVLRRVEARIAGKGAKRVIENEKGLVERDKA